MIYGANLFLMENNGKFLFSLQTGQKNYLLLWKVILGPLDNFIFRCNLAKQFYFFGKVSQGQKFLRWTSSFVLPSPLKSCLFVIYLGASASSRFAKSYLLRLFCLLLHHIAKKCVRKSIKEEQGTSFPPSRLSHLWKEFAFFPSH